MVNNDSCYNNERTVKAGRSSQFYIQREKYDPVIQAKYPGKNDKPKHPNAGKETGERCSNCGGVMVYSNQGKAYCKNLCWKK